ncbi:CcoQ/FixQ family Cbb3-type cytochrome c oxidase assembly chaperone [Metapseudomonas furukawaii]|jgi:cytochrome c oxidase cbb3-type subunit 4|uniref:Cytochrome c oxidase subunit CcoQ n=1 Tax=Metapseudomonas furukawaii TaxID=1149133 RepID=A0AAD1BYE9_METFU|nr:MULTISPECIES: CcoQ/FixQ family Cbb3-type cytochrome c oxidase assembly chaperone [Pseudomonas]ELS28777.1 Cytochrome c oxidase subunit CcoQ [Pseudomonas furukawaii]OWJ94954.1 CcoQ/FixQ family Cbb3-type cytochrome c oxidase assembly chaperone [Pseudomonas sp. A46]WAG80723.1 CcoQ/FixQ family Cbb3-type cytochrome c oxidase assembly chaperone [Pseudomonas furukawaii]BAU73553.1 cytochrome c oxidase subunit CcoQ [Pseudomonas furukawaii]
MDIGTLRGIGTFVVFVAFIGVVLWAYSSKRKSSFDEAANLPFADEPKSSERDEHASRSNKE